MSLKIALLLTIFHFSTFKESVIANVESKIENPQQIDTQTVIENNSSDQKIKSPPFDRNLKDFSDEKTANGFSEVLSPLSVISNSQNEPRIRGLSADGNPIWKDSYHESSTDYFQFVLLNFDRHRNRLDAAKKFLFKWMKIDYSYEDFSLTELAIQSRHARNRFFCNYSNSQTGIKKLYYFDFDFSDGTSDRNRVSGLKTVDYVQNEGSQSEYLRSYDFTLAEDCRTISQAEHDPEEIDCVPFMTNENFVIPHVYEVNMVYKNGDKEYKSSGRFFVRSKIIGPEVSPLKPTPVKLPPVPKLVELIRKRIIKAPFFTKKKAVLDSLKSKKIKDRIEQLTEQISEWENENKARLRNAENEYLMNLQKSLKQHRKQQLKDDKNFEQTYDIMRRAVSHINGYNIRMAIRIATREIENRQIMRAYRAKTRYYQREKALVGLMEKLDHMRYLADKHLDDNFNHYFSPEYFK